MRIVGTTTTALSEGATTNPIVINSEDYTAVEGDSVLYGNITAQYLYDGEQWHRIGRGNSWDDPVIVDNWTDFLRFYTSAGVYVKFANKHVDNALNISWGAISGDGSTNNPYIVSTYEELLFVTGATYIYQVKLVDSDTKKYMYNDGTRDIYCIYDDSLTTIDFANEPSMPSDGYTSSLYISSQTNFNGWTLWGIICTSTGYWAISYEVRNMRLLNYVSYNYGVCFGVLETVRDSIIQAEQYGTATNDGNYWITNGGHLYNSSVSIYERGAKKYVLASGRYNFTLDNSHIHVDLEAVSSYTRLGKLVINNTLLTGKIAETGSTTDSFMEKAKDSIIDLEFDRSMTFYDGVSNSIYNNEKITNQSTTTGLTGLTTAQLKSASDIADTGFPIGVDS